VVVGCCLERQCLKEIELLVELKVVYSDLKGIKYDR